MERENCKSMRGASGPPKALFTGGTLESHFSSFHNNWMAWFLTVTVPLLVIVYHYIAMSRLAAKQPPHTKEIIEELLHVRVPTGKVVPNHADTKLLYVKYTTSDTWAIYMFDVKSGSTKLLRQIGMGGLKVLGWSPDDRFFAYARNLNTEIDICDGQSGKECSRNIVSGGASKGVWLSSETFLCSDDNQIVELSLRPDGWSKTLFYTTPGTNAWTHSGGSSDTLPIGEIRSLSALDSNSVLWQQSNVIYSQSKGQSPCVIWRATNCTLLEFSFSSESNSFLLHCQGGQGDFLAEYNPGNRAITDITRLDTGKYQPIEAQWINHAKGYAYLDQSLFALNKLVIKITRSSPPIIFPWQDNFTGFFINGLQLYVITSKAGEPPGIWRCDLSSGSSVCLVSSIDHPFKYAAYAPVQTEYMTNTLGERLIYYLFRPTTFDKVNKYPLVVCSWGGGQTGYSWDRLEQGIANCGGYFICVDRAGRGGDKWAGDTLSACEYVSKHYPIDTNSIYLMGVCAGAPFATDLLESKPDIWKGAFLFTVPRFPISARMRAHSIALDSGILGFSDDEKAGLFKSQADLAALGIRPILTAHPNAGHLVRTVALDRERMEQLAEFIHQP